MRFRGSGKKKGFCGETHKKVSCKIYSIELLAFLGIRKIPSRNQMQIEKLKFVCENLLELRIKSTYP